MLESIFSAFSGGLSALISGSVTGLLGSVIMSGIQIWATSIKLKYELEKAKLRVQEVSLEVRRAEIEGETFADIADANMMAASYGTDAARFATGERWSNSLLFAIVDFMRGITRPLMTWALVGFVAFQYYEINQGLQAAGVAITAEQAFELYQQYQYTAIYAAFTALMWWFGSRASGWMQDKVMK